jgi:superfamily I DNA/RNA helicase
VRRVPPQQEAVDALLEGLNPPQREAVTAGGGPLLILAGAGSGKTRVLTHRIAYLLRTGQARADEILAITFTNKAAQEMRERVELLVGRATRAMWVMTFHSACARMLRADAHRLGYTRQFTIYDSADQRRLIKKCLDDLDIDPKRFTPRAMQAQISDAKNKLRAADDYRQLVGSFFEQTVADVYEAYERELHRANAMDFDDLLFRAVNLLELFQEVRDRYSNAFRWILVDEYQDTNQAQYRWLQLLSDEHRNLAVVGDDDQCLVEGTLVTMADGSTRPIEDVREGDEVMSCYGSGEFRAARVTAAFKSIAPWGVAIDTATGRRVVSTPEHTHFAAFKTGHTGPAHLTYLMFRRDKGYRLGVTRTWRRTVTVTLCADRRGATPLHLVAVGGQWGESRARLEAAGLTVNDGRTPGSWRFQKFSSDLGTIEKTVAQLRSLLDVHVKRVARLGAIGAPGSNALAMVPAGSVKPGMVMVDDSGAFDVVTSVERVPLDVPVYDLNVERTHNFIANGLVTHNSVYGFRGADIRNILDFEDDYVDAHVVRLEQNYRSTQTILSAANAVVSNNRGRKAKSLWTEIGEGDPIKVRELADEHAEARFVAAEIERLVDEGVSRAELAVFYRTNAQSRVLEDMLVRAQIGYQVIGGTKFYERAEIKDAIAYLTFLVNPADGGAFTRIANSPKRGIGQTSLSRVLAHAETMGITPWEAAAAAEDVPTLGTAARRALGRFMSTLERLKERVDAGAPVAEVLEEMLRETGYLDALEAERTIEAQGRIENLEELVRVGREYDANAGAEGEAAGVAEFLQQIALIADADSIRDDEGLVTLMTLHNAKGLEFPIVFMIGCEDGVFPHSRALDEGALEEERRLAYVGITRAMRDLYITYARRRNVFGAESFGVRSRFIDEIPRELTDQPDRNAVGIGRPAGAGRVASWATAAAASEEASGPGPPRGGVDGAGQVFRMGDDVVHAAFGEGVVLGVEPGGIVVVHFASDGSQRKLMADYAPIRKR